MAWLREIDKWFAEAVLPSVSVTSIDAALEVIQDGAKVTPTITDGKFSLPMGQRAGWVRVNVRDAGGRLLMIGNPIYLTLAP